MSLTFVLGSYNLLEKKPCNLVSQSLGVETTQLSVYLGFYLCIVFIMVDPILFLQMAQIREQYIVTVGNSNKKI